MQMTDSNHFYRVIGIHDEENIDRTSLKKIANELRIPTSRLRYYNENNVIPTGNDLEIITTKFQITKEEIMLRMGHIDGELLKAIQEYASDIHKITSKFNQTTIPEQKNIDLVFETDLGKLYQGDCLDILSQTRSDTVDCIFADPPFNLNKLYPSKIDDNLKMEKYLDWSYKWLDECTRILKHGGALFVWNLPKWNSILANFLHGKLNFKHWISVDLKYSLPIQGRLYPSHYSLLYFIKGEKPNTFNPDRLPMQVCRHCYGELKDYGGYKDKMNPKGINLTDIWLDIPPVRHSKYKRRMDANELSIKLLDRIIELSTREGDLVLDPFGGSGTTYITAELKKRRWIGCEIGPTDVIADRFKLLKEEFAILQKYRNNLNTLFPDDIKKERKARDLWTCDCFKKEAEAV